MSLFSAIPRADTFESPEHKICSMLLFNALRDLQKEIIYLPCPFSINAGLTSDVELTNKRFRKINT